MKTRLPVIVYFRIMFRWLFLLLLVTAARGQDKPLALNAPLNADAQAAFDHWNISHPDVKFHSSFRPYYSSTFPTATDSMLPFRTAPFVSSYMSATVGRTMWQWLPIVDVEMGYDALLKKGIVATSIGAQATARITDHLVMSFTGVGGNLSMPFFLDTTVALRKILPGIGQAYGDGKGGYNYFNWTGHISWAPKRSKVFSFQLGRDRYFIGDGYRSLLLSDFTAPIPYFRINANLWRFQYNVWYTWLFDVTNAQGRKASFRNKFATFHYLSYNIIKELNVSFFENIIWRGNDTNQNRSYDVNYLNPVIFFRPVEYANGSPDNSFLGMNISGIIRKKVKVYVQLAIDEFYLAEIRAHRGWWANKQGWQIGAKYINAFGLKGLKVQGEYNEVRPYTYTHGLVDQNYSHYGLPLAHPFGANFREFLGIIEYRTGLWQFSAEGIAAVIGMDSTSAKSNVGQNIFLSYTTRNKDYGNYTTQGVRTKLLQSTLKAVWHVWPEANGRLEVGYIQRAVNNTVGYKLQNPYFYIAFRTTLWNNYRDF